MAKQRLILGLALVLGLVLIQAGDLNAAKAKGKKNSGQHAISGTVVSVKHGKNNNGSGTIQVRVKQHGKKKGKSAAKGGQGHTVTVHVNQGTKFERHGGAGKNNKNAQKAASFSDVQAGQHVHIKLDRGHHAQKVGIGGGQKKGGKKT